MEKLGEGGEMMGKASVVLGGSRRAQAKFLPDPRSVTHWGAFLGFALSTNAAISLQG